MPLSPGTRLGVYDVIAQIGQGGMGEVYRARDTKLNRDVALKVLPDAFASDPDRLARFEREAKVLASLNHPNIGANYGLETSGNTRALVLELVEGGDSHGPFGALSSRFFTAKPETNRWCEYRGSEVHSVIDMWHKRGATVAPTLQRKEKVRG